MKKRSNVSVTSGPPTDIIKQMVALYNQGQLEALILQAERYTKQFSDSFMFWNLLGAANSGLGRLSEAEFCFLQATQLSQNNPDGLNNLGSILQAQGKLEDAIAAFNKALFHKPDSSIRHM